MIEMISKFSASIQSGIAPLNVNFINESTGPWVRCEWDFGGIGRSSEINPSFKFLNDGVFSVKLTIYDDQGNENIYVRSITVFSNTNVAQDQVNIQYGLFTTKRFDPGQVNVVKQTSHGSEFTTEYPLSGKSSLGTYAFNLDISGSTLNNTNTIKCVCVDSKFKPFVTDERSSLEHTYLLIGLIDTGNTNLSTGKPFSYYYSGNSIEFPQTICYKVTQITTGASIHTLTLDRPAPNTGIDVSGKYFPGVLLISDTGTSYQSNLFYSDYNKSLRKVLSIDSYGKIETSGMININSGANGTISYLGYDDGTGKTLSCFYLNYSGYNSADAFYPGSVYFHLPTVMWHNSRTPGLTLYDSVDSTRREDNNLFRYRYLRDGQTTSSKIVGKVYYDKKLIIIDDNEINTALQFNSNRSYTLPEMNLNINNTSDGSGYHDTGVSYYVTYRVYDDSTPTTANTSFGMGSLKPLHCRYIQKADLSQSTTAASIYSTIALDYRSPWFTNSSTNGTGFTVGGLDIIIGTGSSTSNVPDYTSFKYSSMTNNLSMLFLSGSNFQLPNYTSFTESYIFNNDYLSGNTDLSFGTEIIGFGYLSGNLESTTYKMAATCVARNNEFNSTQNPTFNSSVNTQTYITEVGLYNENNELLMVGKLNRPIPKDDEKYVVVKMELDI